MSSFQFESALAADKSYVCLRCCGVLSDLDSIVTAYRIALEQSAQNGNLNVLVDVVELDIHNSADTIMQFFRILRDDNWLQNRKIARLLAKEEFSNTLIGEIIECYELPMKNFTEKEEAIRWLLES